MTSDLAGEGFIPYGSPTDDDIRGLNLSDFFDSQLSIWGEAFVDTNDNLHLSGTELSDSEWLEDLLRLQSNHDTNPVANVKDAINVEFAGLVMEIDEDLKDDNYPDKHALTPQFMPITDFAGPVKFALPLQHILDGDISQIDLGESVLQFPCSYGFDSAFQQTPAPEPHWLNGHDIGEDIEAGPLIPYQGETNSYSAVQCPIHGPYNPTVGQASALQHFVPVDAQCGQDQQVSLLYQQRQQQQQNLPSAFSQFPFSQGNTSVAHPPLIIHNFNFITAKSVIINAFSGRQHEAQ